MYLILSRLFKYSRVYQYLVQVLEIQKATNWYNMKKNQAIISLTCLEVIQVFSRD